MENKEGLCSVVESLKIDGFTIFVLGKNREISCRILSKDKKSKYLKTFGKDVIEEVVFDEWNEK